MGVNVTAKVKTACMWLPASKDPPPLPSSPKKNHRLSRADSKQTVIATPSSHKPPPLNRVESKHHLDQSGPPPAFDIAASKRMELIKAARNPSLQKAASTLSTLKKTFKNKTDKAGGDGDAPDERPKMIVGRAGLPLVTGSKKTDKMSKAQAKTDEEAFKAFYKDFRIIFVDLPVPTDEYPRKEYRGDLSEIC